MVISIPACRAHPPVRHYKGASTVGGLHAVLRFFCQSHRFIVKVILGVDDFIIYSTTSTIAAFHIDPNDHSLIFNEVYAPYPIALSYAREDNRVYFATVSSMLLWFYKPRLNYRLLICNYAYLFKFLFGTLLF